MDEDVAFAQFAAYTDASGLEPALEPLIGDLIAARPPEWPADDVFDWLLDEARSGLALTERGALSRALCVEVARRRPA